jgi:hypothetical protein
VKQINSSNTGVETIPRPTTISNMKSKASTGKRRKAVSKGIERICSHSIEWNLEGRELELSDLDIEHIQNMLIDNYVAGELCTIAPSGKEVFGWWSIQI